MCGAFTEPLQTYLGAASTFQRHYRHHACWRNWTAYFREIDGLRQFAEFASVIVTLRSDYVGRDESEPIALWDILNLVRFQDSSEVRDRIYGVLAFVTDWVDDNPIVPDYSLSATEVFSQAMLEIIRNMGSLDLICTKIGV